MLSTALAKSLPVSKICNAINNCNRRIDDNALSNYKTAEKFTLKIYQCIKQNDNALLIMESRVTENTKLDPLASKKSGTLKNEL